jgi:hypothetical protein
MANVDLSSVVFSLLIPFFFTFSLLKNLLHGKQYLFSKVSISISNILPEDLGILKISE